jgi:hypothetical protein
MQNFGFYSQLGTRLDSLMPFVAHRMDGKRGDDNNLWESDSFCWFENYKIDAHDVSEKKSKR